MRNKFSARKLLKWLKLGLVEISIWEIFSFLGPKILGKYPGNEKNFRFSDLGQKSIELVSMVFGGGLTPF